jgi:hypothetical protein
VNIAFPALILLCLLLPGFAFHSSFRRTEKTNLDHKPFTSQTTSILLAAFLLHMLGILGYRYLCCGAWPELEHLFILLTGYAGTALENSISSVAPHTTKIVFYLFILSIFSFVLGQYVRGIITKYQWDVDGRFSELLRFDTPWYYLFNGKIDTKDLNPDGVYITALVELSGQTYLYTGILKKYFLDVDGQLERFVLSTVSRRPLTKDREDSERPQDATYDFNIEMPDDFFENRFYPIDGDYFVLRYSEVTTLNVQYFWLEDEDYYTETITQ